MGNATAFEKEKLVVGIMYTAAVQYEEALARLISDYGQPDLICPEYSFSDFSVYYEGEMEGKVLKRFVSFRDLVDPSRLSQIKLHTNDIESDFAVNGDRRVNIDPCLLSHGKFVMATTKEASFRVPLENGIYADLSLVYAKKKWNEFFWTYFDVKSDMIKNFLLEVRKIYREQRKSK